ncbi:hypothetical protein [Endozoicomonas sp. Mp262]|uniref:glycosyltransferase n=1 Tax=Endozoicomonas sp. Mp262 TaxID=2919499 RepID=UPI0021D84F19
MNNKACVLHLTHTNIDCDSRILKEMNAVYDKDIDLLGIGIEFDEGAEYSGENYKFTTENINLLSKKLRILPKFIRHLCVLLELILRMLPKIVKKRPIIIHCHDIVVLPVAVLSKIFKKSFIIYDAHELESDRNGLSQMLGKATLFIERKLWRFVDHLIVVSPSIENWYSENVGQKPSTIVFNSPFLKEERKKIDSNYLRNKYRIPDNHKIFIYIGIFCQGRGIEKILEVFKDSTINASVVFLGYGELIDDLQCCSENFDNIYIHESVAHEDVVPIASTADAGLCLIENVSLSDYYCLPNKLFEYIFSGIPILASDIPDVKYIIDRYKLGITCRLDVKSIKIAIDNYIRGNVTVDFTTSSLERYSWKAQEEKLKKIYQHELTS